MFSTRILLASIVLSGVALGCKERDTPPAAPSGGTFTGNGAMAARKDGGRPPERDGGAMHDGGFDGGLSTSGATLDECKKVSPAAFLNGDTSDGLLNGVNPPMDFNVTRVVATWRTSCVEPTILIEMSEGSCPDGEEHRLQIQLDAKAIQDGVKIKAGFNTLTPELDDPGVRFLYIRPSRLSPDGVWGTCAGEPGTLEFIDLPTVTKDSRLEARFLLNLAACDGSDNVEQVVRGNFNVQLARGLEDVCPSKK